MNEELEKIKPAQYRVVIQETINKTITVTANTESKAKETALRDSNLLYDREEFTGTNILSIEKVT